MDTLFEAFRSLRFASPLFLLLFVPLLYLLFFGFQLPMKRRSGKHRGIAVSALQDTNTIGIRIARVARFTRIALLFSMIVGTVFLFAEPSIDIGNDAPLSEKVEIRRTLLVVFDISLSMDSTIGKNGNMKRFDVARDSLTVFLEEQENIRVGIILFSTEAFQYRRPTSDIDSLITDVSRLAIRRSAEGGLGRNQMLGLVHQTETAQALALAQGVLEDLPLTNKRSRAVILITDLLDSADEIGDAIKELTRFDIRVFILSIKNRTVNLTPKEQGFNTLPNVYVYAVGSREDIEQVYDEISRIEKEEVLVRELVSTRQSIVLEIALALFIVSVMFALSMEIFFRKVRKE